MLNEHGYSGSFTATMTGCVSNPTASVAYEVAGQMVTLILPDISCASNATTLTLTGLPAALQPAAGRSFNTQVIRAEDNSLNALAHGTLVGSSGTMTYYVAGVGGSVAWTNTNNKALYAHTFTYPRW